MKITRPRPHRYHAVQPIGMLRVMAAAAQHPHVYFIDVHGRIHSYAAVAVARAFGEPLPHNIVWWATNINNFNLHCSSTGQRIPSAKGIVE